MTSSGDGDTLGTGGSSAVDEETADEVKVFRSSAAEEEEDPAELAGSSADLDAHKQDVAIEADLESEQANHLGHHLQSSSFSNNPLFNNPLAGPLNWPTPGSNFVFHQLLAAASLSPVYGPTIQKITTAMAAQQIAAAMVARYSPNYLGLGPAAAQGASPFGAGNIFERPPSFSLSQPCTPSSSSNQRGNQHNGQHHNINFGSHQASSSTNGPNALNGGGTMPHHPLNSPMGALGGVLSGMRLTPTGPKMSGHGASAALRTPKREKPERKEKGGGREEGHGGGSNSKDHIKKPMNAFMLFMKANRHKYLEESADKRKQSAELNKELGQIWQAMNRDAQQPYYDMAQKAKEEHARMHPQWSARENYAIHKKAKKKRVREKSAENNEQKKCRARFGVDNQAKWCKHCRRKKRCLNVLRDSDSPVQVSSTTNPTTPLHHHHNQFGGPVDMMFMGGSAAPSSSAQLRKEEGTATNGSNTTNNGSDRTTTTTGSLRCSSAESNSAASSFAESNGSSAGMMMMMEQDQHHQQEEEEAVERKHQKMEQQDEEEEEEGLDSTMVENNTVGAIGATPTTNKNNNNGFQMIQHPVPQCLAQSSGTHPTPISSSAAEIKPPPGLIHPTPAGPLPAAFQMNPNFPFPSPNFAQNPFLSFGRFGF